jgi:flagellar assembly protein FliH
MGTIIKAGRVAQGKRLPGLGTFDLRDHWAEAQRGVEDARRQSAALLQEAEAKAAALFDDAHQRGFAEGRKEGLDQGIEEGRQAARQQAIDEFTRAQAGLVASLRQALEAIETFKTEFEQAAEREVFDFAILLAKKLTCEIGRLHREAAVENLRRALRLVDSQWNLIIRAHPDDLASLETFAASLKDAFAASRTVRLAADESLAPGGCVVETERTRVDASLETQINELVSLLVGESRPDA